MAHHKRRRPKHQRAGCLFCKPQKDERGPRTPRPSVQRRTQVSPDSMIDFDDTADCRGPCCMNDGDPCGCGYFYTTQDGCPVCAPELGGEHREVMHATIADRVWRAA